MRMIREGNLPTKECGFCKSSLEYSKEDIIDDVWYEINDCLTICRHNYYIKCPKCSNKIKLTREEVIGVN